MSSEPRPPESPAPRPRPRDRYALSVFIFLRLLAVIFLVAFVSFWIQMPGLIGADGIMPAPAVAGGSNASLHVLCGLGTVLSALLLAGLAPAFCLLALWAAYLALMGAAPLFLGYQWDALLLETALLAAFVAPWSLTPSWTLTEPPPIARWLLRWLLFRLMFLSGVVKLTSGDPAWRGLEALRFHYETQPLPTPIAWWVHQLPDSVHRAACAGMFMIELVVPFFLWFPRPLRHNAAILMMVLQAGIAVTGNFAFFNWLTIALCLLCLDDAWWLAVLRPVCRRCAGWYETAWKSRTQAARRQRRDWRRAEGDGSEDAGNQWAAGAAVAVVAYTCVLALPAFGREWPRWFLFLVEDVAPFSTFNNYGLFAVMTTTRPELVIEGSRDGQVWRSYELPHKPGLLGARPTFAAPHQPRLDWQLWFAALESPAENGWMRSLAGHLLRGTRSVRTLFRHDPFPDGPPRYIRVLRYRYEFTDPAERRRTGRWWRRELVDVYLEPTALP